MACPPTHPERKRVAQGGREGRRKEQSFYPAKSGEGRNERTRTRLSLSHAHCFRPFLHPFPACKQTKLFRQALSLSFSFSLSLSHGTFCHEFPFSFSPGFMRSARKHKKGMLHACQRQSVRACVCVRQKTHNGSGGRTGQTERDHLQKDFSLAFPVFLPYPVRLVLTRFSRIWFWFLLPPLRAAAAAAALFSQSSGFLSRNSVPKGGGGQCQNLDGAQLSGWCPTKLK